MIHNHMIENAEAYRANAMRRREAGANGGCVMVVNPAAERERLSTLSPDESMHERLAAFWAEVRSFRRELHNGLAAGLTADEAAIPF